MERVKKDIWLKILVDKTDALFELPGFICNWSYDDVERSLYRNKELGKIETQNYNFRFCIEPFKVDLDNK